MKVNIAVLNYNGKELLTECLPSIIEASRKSRFDTKVTVLDNCSTDGSIGLLKEKFPSVIVYTAPQNKVYCSYNEFFMRAGDDIIIILNSDIKVDVNFLDPLVEHFIKDPDVCFVSSKMYYFDGVTYQGDRSRAKNYFGIISADTRFEGHESLIDKTGPTFSTGNGAFDRRKFIELGGFDEIYLPGRYEDVDLCFRAWKSGYKGIYEPESIIYHKGYESFKKAFSDKYIYATVFRNSMFFMLKNISDGWLIFKFCFWMPARLLFFFLNGKFYLVGSFWRALKFLPDVKKRRHEAMRTFKLTDREVLNIVG